MAKRAILHQATRVIKRITVDDNHVVLPGELAVIVPDNLALISGTFQVLQGDNTTRAATAQEIDDAEVDPQLEQQKSRARRALMIQRIDEAIANPSVATIRSYLVAQRAMLRG